MCEQCECFCAALERPEQPEQVWSVLYLQVGTSISLCCFLRLCSRLVPGSTAGVAVVFWLVTWQEALQVSVCTLSRQLILGCVLAHKGRLAPSVANER